MTPRAVLIWAGIGGACAVGMGAFAAHALQDVLSPHLMAVWETATRYLMIHVLALLALAGVGGALGEALRRWPARLWLVGALIFSGSLVLRVLFDAPRWGMVTPLGGVLLIVGWLMLAWCALRLRAPPQ